MKTNTIFDVVRPTMPTSTGRGFLTNKWGANTYIWRNSRYKNHEIGGQKPPFSSSPSLLSVFAVSLFAVPPSLFLSFSFIQKCFLFLGPFGLLLMGLSGLGALGLAYYFLSSQ
jgi:hypothetical protein